MLSGTIHAEMKKCGRPNCRCIRGNLHGPYYYRYFRQNGRLHKRYIRPIELEETQTACDARMAKSGRRRTDQKEQQDQSQEGWHVFRKLLAALKTTQEVNNGIEDEEY